jgi:tRNA 2-thiouridine synthesizing protein A
MEHQHEIDCRGLCCAQPICKLTAGLEHVQPGEVALIVADKSSMTREIPAYCRQMNHALLDQNSEDGLLRFWVRKNGKNT